MKKPIASPSWIRREIVLQILASFKETMPIYEQMMSVAHSVNSQAGEAEANRLGKIMHAAIRCASDNELRTICDLFSLMACEPVNYYDLRERVSVESTAFRPTSAEELEEDGFRVFCSRLSLDCIPTEHRPMVEKIIARRRIFDAAFLTLIETGKQQNGLHQDQAELFIEKCVKVFTRPEEALISLEEYHQLKAINKVACQILVSNSLAFNHLTPSVASVPAAHQEMLRQNIKTIPVWQGPVGKDIVLRQTSCLAPAIMLKFPKGDGTFDEAEYQETFVEFEERLQALTPKGRDLFEAAYAAGKNALKLKEGDPNYADHYYQTMQDALDSFPSDSQELWNQQLAYFTFEVLEKPQTNAKHEAHPNLNDCIQNGSVQLIPQQYEDFFGPTATNIFNSNIGLEEVSQVSIAKLDSQKSYETALGRKVINMDDFYENLQIESKTKALAKIAAI